MNISTALKYRFMDANRNFLKLDAARQAIQIPAVSGCPMPEGTMGIALSSCIPPSKKTTLFQIAGDKMEVGIGIHGKPGRKRTKVVTADEIVDILLEAVVTDLPYNSGDKVALMINGLGGTPISELYLLYGIAHEKLAAQGIEVAKNYVGNYCTSLEMKGASLTLVKLDDEILGLLNEPAEVAVRVF